MTQRVRHLIAKGLMDAATCTEQVGRPKASPDQRLMYWCCGDTTFDIIDIRTGTPLSGSPIDVAQQPTWQHSFSIGKPAWSYDGTALVVMAFPPHMPKHPREESPALLYFYSLPGGACTGVVPCDQLHSVAWAPSIPTCAALVCTQHEWARPTPAGDIRMCILVMTPGEGVLRTIRVSSCLKGLYNGLTWSPGSQLLMAHCRFKMRGLRDSEHGGLSIVDPADGATLYVHPGSAYAEEYDLDAHRWVADTVPADASWSGRAGHLTCSIRSGLSCLVVLFKPECMGAGQGHGVGTVLGPMWVTCAPGWLSKVVMTCHQDQGYTSLPSVAPGGGVAAKSLANCHLQHNQTPSSALYRGWDRGFSLAHLGLWTSQGPLGALPRWQSMGVQLRRHEHKLPLRWAPLQSASVYAIGEAGARVMIVDAQGGLLLCLGSMEQLVHGTVVTRDELEAQLAPRPPKWQLVEASSRIRLSDMDGYISLLVPETELLDSYSSIPQSRQEPPGKIGLAWSPDGRRLAVLGSALSPSTLTFVSFDEPEAPEH